MKYKSVNALNADRLMNKYSRIGQKATDKLNELDALDFKSGGRLEKIIDIVHSRSEALLNMGIAPKPIWLYATKNDKGGGFKDWDTTDIARFSGDNYVPYEKMPKNVLEVIKWARQQKFFDEVLVSHQFGIRHTVLGIKRFPVFTQDHYPLVSWFGIW